jgi:hypothetical protein
MVGKPDRENRRAIEHYGDVRVAGTVPRLKRIDPGALQAVFNRHFDHKVFRP